MKTRLRFLETLGVGLLLLCWFAARGFTQTSPTPGPPAGPGGRNSAMVPTGLATNGGAIANDVYTNSIYGFSLRVPPGWAVAPAPAAQSSATFAGKPVQGHQGNRILLVMSENAPLKKSPARKSLQIIATRLAAPAGPTAAEGFLTYSERMAKEQGLPVESKVCPRE